MFVCLFVVDEYIMSFNHLDSTKIDEWITTILIIISMISLLLDHCVF